MSKDQIKEASLNMLKERLGVNNLELEEFAEGWRVIWHPETPTRGSGTYVIERESGKVLLFSSAVSPARVMENFAEIKDKAIVL